MKVDERSKDRNYEANSYSTNLKIVAYQKVKAIWSCQ